MWTNFTSGALKMLIFASKQASANCKSSWPQPEMSRLKPLVLEYRVVLDRCALKIVENLDFAVRKRYQLDF